MMSAQKQQLPCIGINEMEILQTISQGKTSSVMIVKLPKSDQVYVIKQFQSEYQADLMNEINSLQVLKHENIIELLTFNNMSAVFEYYQNGVLFDVIVKKRMTERVAKFYFKQLMTAVQYVHENRFAHRDIKLENILISNDFNIILADFGFASKTQEGMKFQRCMGTEGYMAPELQLGQRYCGKKADIFASGVVLYCIVMGRPPFIKATLDDAHYKSFLNNNQGYWANFIKRNKISVSNELKDLINRMLSLNENDRPQVSEILGHPWFQEENACSCEEASQFMREIIQTE